jgi:8-oxo-dGTP diphosphatase
MIHEDTFNKVDFNGAKGIVFFDDKIPVYRRDYKTPNFPGHIDLPGGGREEGETPFQTFQREVKEEFGIDVKEGEIVFACTIPSAVEPRKKSFFMVAKTTRFKAEDIIFGNEGSEWLLMTPQEFIHRPDGIKRQQERVAKYLAGGLRSV